MAGGKRHPSGVPGRRVSDAGVEFGSGLEALHVADLVVENGHFLAQEIAPRDDADEAAVVDHRQVAVAARRHAAQGFDGELVGLDRIRVLGHDVAKPRRVGIAAVGNDAMHNVALGEDALEHAVARYQRGADLAITHGAGRFAHGRRRGKLEQLLLADHVRHDSALHGPASCRGVSNARWCGNVVYETLKPQIDGSQASRSATAWAMARQAVSPGDSMPKRLTRPAIPCVSGPWMTKS